MVRRLRSRSRAWPFALSLATHALLALVVVRGTGPASLLSRTARDVLEVEIRVQPPLPEAAPVTPPPAPPSDRAPPASPRRASPPRASRAPKAPRPGPEPRPEPAPRPDATPAPTSATPAPVAEAKPASAPSWLRMRALAAAPPPPSRLPPLVQLPPGEAAPPPPRNEVGLPDIPLPDVIHHPIGKQVQGNSTTSSGLGVKVDREGAITFETPTGAPDVQAGPLDGSVGISGRFDLNNLTERLAGNDPYAYEKRKIAEATFEDRLCLAREAARRRQQEGLFNLNEHLEWLRHLPGLTRPQLREVVFDLWDECMDTGADGEPNLGAAARAGILAFIRRVLPPGTADAYTPAELVALNERRTSRNPFDPYGSFDRVPAPGSADRESPARSQRR